MNALRKHLLIAVTLLGMGSAAVSVQAQQAPAEGRHAHAASQQEHQAKWAEMWAKRQAKLHDALKLSAGQESAWAAYQAAIKPAAPATPVDHSAWASLSAPQREEKMIAMAKQHIAAKEAQLPALNTFYSVLTADQKTIFDKFTRGGMRGGRGMHH